MLQDSSANQYHGIAVLSWLRVTQKVVTNYMACRLGVGVVVISSALIVVVHTFNG